MVPVVKFVLVFTIICLFHTSCIGGGARVGGGSGRSSRGGSYGTPTTGRRTGGGIGSNVRPMPIGRSARSSSTSISLECPFSLLSFLLMLHFN